MKIVMPILCLLVVLGVMFGMAKVGILPAQKWADKNPKLAPILRSLHLAKLPKKKAVPALAASTPKNPAAQALADGQKQLAADRTHFAQEQAAWQKQKNAPAPASVSALPSATTTPVAGQPVPAKLSAIYAAMSPDDLARVLGKLPDPPVVQTLLALDPKKAGKILAALPDARAAHLTTLMMRTSPPLPAQTASNAPAPVPATSL